MTQTRRQHAIRLITGMLCIEANVDKMPVTKIKLIGYNYSTEWTFVRVNDLLLSISLVRVAFSPDTQLTHSRLSTFGSHYFF